MGAVSGMFGGRALLCALATTAALIASGGSGAIAAAKADRCRAQSAEVESRADLARAERSLLCLVNVQRAAAGVPVLPAADSLAAAARSHSEDMVARGFYSHTNPDGAGPGDRAAAAGYRSSVGENIAWLPLSLGPSPIQFVNAWSESAENNENMLSWRYLAVGAGIAPGTPEPQTAGATATVVFGVAPAAGTYTGLDMLVPAQCTRAKKKVRKAKKKLKAARAKGRGVGRARKQLKRRKAAAKRACNPSSF